MAHSDQCKDKGNLLFFTKRCALILTQQVNGSSQGRIILRKKGYILQFSTKFIHILINVGIFARELIL